MCFMKKPKVQTPAPPPPPPPPPAPTETPTMATQVSNDAPSNVAGNTGRKRTGLSSLQISRGGSGLNIPN